MNFKKYTLSLFSAFMMAGLAASAGATEVTTHAIMPFTAAAPSATYTGDNAIEVKSFYNPDMGYKGWVHQSGWGYMKLTSGLPVTITAETSVAGFHPAIAVWRNAGSAPINYYRSEASMPYDQWGDVVETKGLTDGDGNKVKGTIKMYFITNGVDRDGWDEPADFPTYFANESKFDQSLINRILDGTEGKISVTFTPPVTGTYKFAVGGMNPDPGLTGRAEVDVTVAFPQVASVPIIPPPANPGVYNITAVFSEPQLQPVNTTFTGSFTWDPAHSQITNLKGAINQAMIGAAPTVNLSYQNLPSASDGAGGILVTVFKLNTTDVFAEGGYAPGGKIAKGNGNAYFTLDVNSSDPTKVSTGNLSKIAYADCSPGGVMGQLCMTGHAAGGTMGATPLSLKITAAK